MENPIKYLKASDGTGPAVLAHVSVARAALDTTLEVDSIDNWPSEGIAASGVLLPSGFIDEDTLTEFRFHTSGGDIVIDEICPGFTDNGNGTDEVVVVKQTTDWADILAEALRLMVPAGVINPYGGSVAPDGWLLCQGQSLLRTDYPDLFDAIGTSFGAVDGTHFSLPDGRGRTFVGVGTGTFAVDLAAADVTTATDLFTVSAAEGALLHTGMAVVLTTSGGAPGGLTAGNTYYIVKQSATTFKLATNVVNAVAGTVIDITSQGTGTHTFTHTLTARALADRFGEESHLLAITEMPAHTHDLPGISTDTSANGSARPNVKDLAQDRTYASAATGGSQPHNIMQPSLAVNFIIKT